MIPAARPDGPDDRICTSATTGVEEVPPDLLEAFTAYEVAVLSNDLDALDAAFASGPDTLRGDQTGLLVGHDAISDFRSTRRPVSSRIIERIDHRPLGPDTALLVSVSRFAGGGRGVQTQVWRRIDGSWLIIAAHITPRPQALERSVWRTVGDPLWQGAWEGPLTGLTVAVKDLFAISGYRIGAGNPTYLDGARPESTTAPAVSDLLRGGASLRGIARTDEFAYSIAGDNPHYGTPPNGALAGALPGGSSSGPASAVATGQADVGLATDTAGSIRVPASYQGLWGLRTTHGLVPRQGLLPLAQSFDTIGWVARDGDTLQRVADWCLGYEGSEPLESAHVEGVHELPWNFVVPREMLDSVDTETRIAFDRLLTDLSATAGTPTIGIVSIGDLDDYLEVFRAVQSAEAWRNNGTWVEAHPGALGDAAAERFLSASTVSESDERVARRRLEPLAERLTDLVDGQVMLMPTAPGPAPGQSVSREEIDATRTRTLRMTTPAAVAGLPSLSTPLLTVRSPLGLAPVGVCLTSGAGTDLALVRLARRLARSVAESGP